MSRLPLSPSTPRRSLIWGAAATLTLALVSALTGCGSEGSVDTGAGSGSSEPPSTAPADNEFCVEVDGIGDDLSVADLTADWTSDPQGYVAAIEAAAERFSTVAAPEEIAGSWRALDEFFTVASTALAGVDATDAAAIEGALKFDGENAFAMVIQLPGQAETVGAFVQDECGIDLGILPPVIADVCEAVDGSHLSSVFGDAVPEGENRRWGQGVVECVWGDDGGNEVGVVVGPIDTVRSDLLQGQDPIDAAQVDAGSIDLYDGALGPLRSAAGRTAALDVSGTAVLTSVRTGDPQAEVSAAIALAELTAERVG